MELFPARQQKTYTYGTRYTTQSAFRFCYARLTKLATICCGNHFDDRENDLPKSLKEEILEENMLKLLQMEVLSANLDG